MFAITLEPLIQLPVLLNFGCRMVYQTKYCCLWGVVSCTDKADSVLPEHHFVLTSYSISVL